MKNLHKELFSTKGLKPPYSLSVDECRINIDGVHENIQCKKCVTYECFKEKSRGYSECTKKQKFYSDIINKRKIVLYGIYSKKRGVNEKEIKEWICLYERIMLSIEKYSEKNSEKSISKLLHYLHDPVKWAKSLLLASEKIIEKQEGGTFSEKLSSSNNESKAVYHTAKLLDESFNQMTIHLNPESASFGSPRKTDIYKLFDKIQAILFHTIGKKENKRFKLEGSTNKTYMLRENFSIIPMSILENSIKYSKSGELIHIRFDDYNEKTSIKITSTGPYIEENEQEKIFEKEFRGKYAKEKNIEGQGIGLYTSKLVAKTNNCEIIFSSKQLNFLFEKTPMAENTFNIVINRF